MISSALTKVGRWFVSTQISAAALIREPRKGAVLIRVAALNRSFTVCRIAPCTNDVTNFGCPLWLTHWLDPYKSFWESHLCRRIYVVLEDFYRQKKQSPACFDFGALQSKICYVMFQYSAIQDRATDPISTAFIDQVRVYILILTVYRVTWTGFCSL